MFDLRVSFQLGSDLEEEEEEEEELGSF